MKKPSTNTLTHGHTGGLTLNPSDFSYTDYDFTGIDTIFNLKCNFKYLCVLFIR